MELFLILAIPVVTAPLTMIAGRFAAVLTLAASFVVLVLAIHAAGTVLDLGTVSAFGASLVLDPLSALYLVLVAFVGLTSALYGIGYLGAREQGKAVAKTSRNGFYYPLFNIFLASLLAVPLIANLAVIWIAIELTTIFSAFLVAYDDRRESLEAAWKYVMLTSVGAMIALLGILILYYAVDSHGEAVTWAGLVAVAADIHPAILLMAFIFCLIGFGAKAGLVPLHSWLPDAHSQAPATICALLSGVETSAALYVILRLYPALSRNPLLPQVDTWFVVTGLVTLGAAAVLLLQVTDFKRLFAFSTVEHMGIMMAACGLGTAGAQLGVIYQLFGHALTKSFCFYAAGLATIALGNQEIGPANKGLMARSPIAGFSVMIGALAITGAPPFVLFFSEFQILFAGIEGGAYVVTGLLLLFIVVAFVAVIYQVGRVVFGSPESERPMVPTVRLPLTSVISLGLAITPVVAFGLYLPAPVYRLIILAAKQLGIGP